MSEIILRPATPDDWEALRDLRIEMVEDTPIAYRDTLAEVRALSDDDWRTRAARSGWPNALYVVAEDAPGHLVGLMVGVDPDDGTGPWLYSVYVAAAYRGREHGIADALLAMIESWAAPRGGRLKLHVGETNDRAREFYVKHGYAFTGERERNTYDPSVDDVEMVKALP